MSAANLVDSLFIGGAILGAYSGNLCAVFRATSGYKPYFRKHIVGGAIVTAGLLGGVGMTIEHFEKPDVSVTPAPIPR